MTAPTLSTGYKPVNGFDEATGRPRARLYNDSKQNYKYNTEGMSYPSDLLTAGSNNPYGGNYVVFYVNVHEDSVLTKSKDAAYVPPNAQIGSQRGAAADLTRTQIAVGTGVTAVAGTTGIAAVTGANAGAKAVGAVTGKLTPAAGVAANVGVGLVGAGALVTKVGGVKADMRRQLKAIALHIPTDLSIRYTASWDAEAMAGQMAIAQGAGPAIAAAAAAGAAGFAVGGPAGAVVAGALGGGGAALAGAGGSYLAGQALQLPGGQLLGKTTGTAANPKKEQLFREVDFRTFTFSYQFFPRNAQEAAAVRNIIREFKLHMHPEFKDSSGFLYIYPSEFDIVYYQNGKENLNLHRHTSCVLTDFSVSYSPQGNFATFADGMPAQVNVQMTFKELALLTKDNIMDGF